MHRTREEPGHLYPIVGIGGGIVLLFLAWITRLAGLRTGPASYIIFAAGVLVIVASAIHFRVELIRVLSPVHAPCCQWLHRDGSVTSRLARLTG